MQKRLKERERKRDNVESEKVGTAKHLCSSCNCDRNGFSLSRPNFFSELLS